MTIVWLLLLLVPLFLYLVLMDIRANREKNERKETIKHLKQEAAGDPDPFKRLFLGKALLNRVQDGHLTGGPLYAKHPRCG